MKNWIILLILTVAYIAVCVACFSEPQRRAQSEMKVVSLPKALFWVGLLTGCVFLVMALAGYRSTHNNQDMPLLSSPSGSSTAVSKKMPLIFD